MHAGYIFNTLQCTSICTYTTFAADSASDSLEEPLGLQGRAIYQNEALQKLEMTIFFKVLYFVLLK